MTESNRFVWPGQDVGPLDTDNCYYGPLPPALLDEVKRHFVELARSQRQLATPDRVRRTRTIIAVSHVVRTRVRR